MQFRRTNQNLVINNGRRVQTSSPMRPTIIILQAICEKVGKYLFLVFLYFVPPTPAVRIPLNPSIVLLQKCRTKMQTWHA